MADLYDKLKPSKLEGNPAKDEIIQLLNKYKKVTTDIDREASKLLRGLDNPVNKTQIIDKLKILSKRADKSFASLEKSAENWAKIAAPKSHITGQALADSYIKKQSKVINKDGNMTQILDLKPKNKEAIRKVIDRVTTETLRDVNLINNSWRKRFDNIIRTGIKDTRGIKLIKRPGIRGGITTGKEIGSRLYQEIKDSGLKLIDKAGNKWTPERYIRMYSRTRTRELQTQGIENRMNDYKLDLVKISIHVDVDGIDICNDYEGKVFSLSGNHPVYPQLDVHCPFHHNCVHVETPWVEKYQQEMVKQGKPLDPGEFKNPEDASKWLKNKYSVDSDFSFKARNSDWPNTLKKLGYSDMEILDVTDEMLDSVIDLDMKLINENMKKFDELAKEFPGVANKLEYMGTYGKNAPKGLENYQWSGAYAHAYENGKQIGLNPNYYYDYDKFAKSLANDVAAGWHPAGTSNPTSVLTHEFGHQVHNYYLNNGWGELDDFFIHKLRYGHKETRVNYIMENFLEQTHKTLADAGLSRYALKNSRESFAEAFSAIYEKSSLKNKYVQAQKSLLKMLKKENLHHIDDVLNISSLDPVKEFQRQLDLSGELSEFLNELYDSWK